MRNLAVTILLGLFAVLPVAPANAATIDQATFSQRVLELTNAQRQAAGLQPLVLNPQLSQAAQSYTEVLASSDCFAHTCGAVPQFSDRIAQTGYAGWNALAENIAAGYPTPEAVVAGWMSSPGHRENILTPGFNEMGVGVVSSAGKFGTYWTQEFGGRATAVVQLAPPAADDPATPSDAGSGA